MNRTASNPQHPAQGLTTHGAMPTAPTRPARLLRFPAVRERTGQGKSSTYAAMAAGTFPLPVRVGARGVAWREDEIDAWIQSRQTAEIRPVIQKTRTEVEGQ